LHHTVVTIIGVYFMHNAWLYITVVVLYFCSIIYLLQQQLGIKVFCWSVVLLTVFLFHEVCYHHNSAGKHLQ